MHVSYKFVRHRSGANNVGVISSFAKITIESSTASEWSVEWPDLSKLPSRQAGELKYFGADIEAGVTFAIEEAKRRKLAPRMVIVVSLEILPTDTQADAVRCAATLCAWESFGGRLDECVVTFQNGEWRVTEIVSALGSC